jgi:hypothetical protein
LSSIWRSVSVSGEPQSPLVVPTLAGIASEFRPNPVSRAPGSQKFSLLSDFRGRPGEGLAIVGGIGADAFHFGSGRSGLVGSTIAGEGSRTGFYTDEYDQQTYRPPENYLMHRKHSILEVVRRGISDACQGGVAIPATAP